MRLSETVQDFKDYFSHEGASTSWRTYRYAIQRFIQYVDDKHIEDLTMDDVASYKKALEEKRITRARGFGRPYKHAIPSASYVSTQLSALKAFFFWLHEHRGLTLDMIDAQKRFTRLRPKISRPKPECPEKWEIDALKEKAVDREDQMLILMLSNTGLRIHELLGLSRLQIEKKRAEDGTISYSLKGIIGKGRKVRDVPLNDMVIRELESYLHYLDVVYPKSDKLFHRTYKTVWRRLKMLSKAADVSEVTPHGLRHAFATRLLKADVDLRTIQDLLGHSSIATTQIYLEVDDARKRAAVEMLSSLES